MQAFWDSLIDDLKLPTICFVRVLRVLAEIRDALVEVAGSREAVDEVLDIPFIKNQAELGLYGWESCTRLLGGVVSIIQRVQEPKREAETRVLWAAVWSTGSADQAVVFCKALEVLLGRVNILRIDAANAR